MCRNVCFWNVYTLTTADEMALYLIGYTITSVKFFKKLIINSLFATLFCAYCEIAEDEEDMACAQAPGRADWIHGCPSRRL